MSVLGIDIGVYVGGQRDDAAFKRMTVAIERTGAELAHIGRYVYPKLIPIFEAAAEKQFDAEGGGPGGAWSPLSPTYAEWKAKRYPGAPILEATGRLRAALTESMSPFAEREYSDTDFAFGTRNVPYASFHQVGTDRMVARPFFDFGGETERAIAAEGNEALREAARASGLEEFAEVTP